MSEINTAQEKMTFAEFQLDESLEKTLSKAGFKEATSIQKLAIPVALEGRDILARAPTGTGKTLAFLLPIFEMLQPEVDTVQCLIIVPSRELGLQIQQVWKQMTS